MGHVACLWEMRSWCKISFVKPKGKRLLGKARLGWEDVVIADVKAVGWEGVDWINLRQVADQWKT